MKIHFFYLLFFSFLSWSAYCQDNNKLVELSKHHQWAKLLQYDNSRPILKPHFYLSPLGHNHPFEELLATIEAFGDTSSTLDNHPQCRYPARYLWLTQKLHLNIKKQHCPSFEAFSQKQHIESLSLIFATGYLGNPASYYGHLLLKINTDKASKTSSLEDNAINFGANIPSNEGTLQYIFKGIFGFYDSSFTSQQYFYHTHNYSETENRDLWEYKLDLTKHNLDLVIAHLWEIMGKDYPYFFFNRNCAYRIGWLLELITDKPLVNSIRPWSIPQSVIQNMATATQNSRPIVSQIIYHPSRQSRLYQRYGNLTSQQRELVHASVEKPAQIQKILSQTTTQSAINITDTLLDYYQFIRDDQKGDDDINNYHYKAALLERFKLPIKKKKKKFISYNEPQQGRGPSYTSIGHTKNKRLNDIFILKLRPAYYDSLDAGYGHIPHSALSMGEVDIGLTSSKLYIRDFNLIKIESIKNNYTNLPRDKNHSWYLEIGAKQKYNTCTNCLSFKVRSGFGYAKGFNKNNLLIAGYVGAGFLDNSLSDEGVYVSSSLSLSIYFTPLLSLRSNLEYRYSGEHISSYISSTQVRFSSSRQTDIRLFYEKREEQELGFTLGYYW